MLRRILGIVAGLVAGFVGVLVVEMLSSLAYPPPDDLDFSDAAAMKAFVSSLPTGAFVFVLAAHCIGAFAAGLACAVVVKKTWMTGSVVLGVVFLVAGIANLMMIPHPVWFSVVDVLCYVPFAVLGGKLGTAKSSPLDTEDPEPEPL